MRRRITAWLLAALIAVAACPAVLATDGGVTTDLNIAADGGDDASAPAVLTADSGVAADLNTTADGGDDASAPAVLAADGDIAADLTITAGEKGAAVGETLTAGYTLADVGEEDVSISWLRSVDSGKTYAEITEATDRAYTIAEEDIGAMLKFRVSPKTGVSGTAVTSAAAATVGNLAMSRPVTVSDDSQIGDKNGNYKDPAALTDGNTNTQVTGRWSTTNNIAFMIDLGETQSVTKLVARANQGSAKITGYEVQVSHMEVPGTAMDSPDWETVAKGEVKPEDGEKIYNWKTLQIVFEPVKARHIRFCVVGINTGWGGAFSLRQLEAYLSFTQMPEITLNGDNPMLIPAGGRYADPGASAVDQEGTDLTDKITVSGAVDTAEPKEFSASYTVTYSVQDRTGNVSTATREVIVYSEKVECRNVKAELSGDAVYGGVLTGSYDWNPYLPDASVCQWLRSAEDGFAVIPGAEGKTYTLDEADIGHQVKFRVQSRSVEQAGKTVDSAPVTYGNLAHGKPVQSNQKPKEGEDALKNVTDGSADTGFTGGYSGTNNMSIVVDLGSARPVNRIIARSNQGTFKITGFKVEYSNAEKPSLAVDSGDWTLLEAREDTSNWKTQEFNFPRVNARYVRFCITAINEKWGGAFSFRELEAYNVNTEPPVITLNGRQKQFVEVNTAFSDAGAAAADEAGVDLSERIAVGGDTVDVKTTGTYTITYDVTDDSGLRAQTASRTVIVHDIDTQPPVITLKGVPSVRVAQGAAYTEPGAVVTDNIDEDLEAVITGTVDTNTLGNYILQYSAADRKGNRAETVTRTVHVVPAGEDVTQPVITLKGGAETSVWQTFAYEEAGYTAADDRDGDLTARVTVGGDTVNTNVLGDYTIVYFVEDSAGNQQIARRTVHVVPIPDPYMDLWELDLGPQNLSAVTEDLTLRVKGSRGSRLAWETSDSTVVRADGTVTRRTADTPVTLTATASLGTESYSREIPVTVKGTGQSGSGGKGGSGGGGGGRPGSGITVDQSVTASPAPTEGKNENLWEPFSDLEDAAWAQLAIQALSARGIINGVDDTHFEPNRSVTREEFVKLLIGLLQLELPSGETPFDDVERDAWYAPYVAAAYQNGLVAGVSDTAFGTGDAITREDLAVLIYRAAQTRGIVLKQTQERAEFTDDAHIAAYAKDAVYALQQAGIINGMGGGAFAPRETATRAAAAKVVYGLAAYLW